MKSFLVYTPNTLDGVGCRVLSRVWAHAAGCDNVDIVSYSNTYDMLSDLIHRFGGCNDGDIIPTQGHVDPDSVQQVLVTGISYHKAVPALLNYLSALTKYVPVLAISHDPHLNYDPNDAFGFRCGCIKRHSICELNLDPHINSQQLHDNCGWYLPIHCDTYKLWAHLVHLLGVHELDAPAYVLLAHEINYATTTVLGELPNVFPSNVFQSKDGSYNVRFSTSCATRSKNFPDTSIDVLYNTNDALSLLYLMEHLEAPVFEDYITASLQFIRENYPVAKSSDLFSVTMSSDHNAKAVKAIMQAYHRIYNRIMSASTFIQRVKSLDNTCFVYTVFVPAPPIPAYLYPELARFILDEHPSHPDAVVICSACDSYDLDSAQYYLSNTLPYRITLRSLHTLFNLEAIPYENGVHFYDTTDPAVVSTD